MPHLVWSGRALADLSRLARFLSPKNQAAGRRGIAAIRLALQQILAFPNAGRPVEDHPYRDLLVPFGSSGYVIRYQRLGDQVIVLAIRHMREAGF